MRATRPDAVRRMSHRGIVYVLVFFVALWLVLVLLFQKYMVQGLTAGSVKG